MVERGSPSTVEKAGRISNERAHRHDQYVPANIASDTFSVWTLHLQLVWLSELCDQVIFVGLWRRSHPCQKSQGASVWSGPDLSPDRMACRFHVSGRVPYKSSEWISSVGFQWTLLSRTQPGWWNHLNHLNSKSSLESRFGASWSPGQGLLAMT